MNTLVSRVGAAALLVGTLISTASLPSFAWGGCNGWNQPVRQEVFGRDARLNREINFNRGYLNGNYGRLEHEDRAIRREAQRDAFYNGGYITPGEARHINRQENRLQQQISWDRRRF